ncbi:MAG: hypothetical protein ACLTT7_02685 [Paraclostridium bifermentans]
MFYVPSFLMGTIIGGSIAYVLLKSMSRSGDPRKYSKKVRVKKFVETNMIFDSVSQMISINDCANLILALGANNYGLSPR